MRSYYEALREAESILFATWTIEIAVRSISIDLDDSYFNVSLKWNQASLI